MHASAGEPRGLTANAQSSEIVTGDSDSPHTSHLSGTHGPDLPRSERNEQPRPTPAWKTQELLSLGRATDWIRRQQALRVPCTDPNPSPPQVTADTKAAEDACKDAFEDLRVSTRRTANAIPVKAMALPQRKRAMTPSVLSTSAAMLHQKQRAQWVQGQVDTYHPGGEAHENAARVHSNGEKTAGEWDRYTRENEEDDAELGIEEAVGEGTVRGWDRTRGEEEEDDAQVDEDLHDETGGWNHRARE